MLIRSISGRAQPLGNINNIEIERFCKERSKLIDSESNHMLIIGFHIMYPLPISGRHPFFTF